MPKDMTQRESLPVASLKDRLAFVAEVTAPMLAKGPLIRRPRAVALSERSISTPARCGGCGRCARPMATGRSSSACPAGPMP
jgi:hypothetical protein